MSVRVNLLDGVAVVEQETGKIFELVLGGQRSRVVFAALVLAAERPLLRRDLASAIWGDDLPAAWASALRTAVSGVWRAVWACQPLAGSRLVTLEDGYRLELSEQVDVDVLELLALVDSAQVALAADPTTALTLAAHCARSDTAVFLPGAQAAGSSRGAPGCAAGSSPRCAWRPRPRW